MARASPPFGFDLNELPPPEDDGENDAASPDPAREPSPQDRSPPPSSEREPSPDLDLDVSLSPLYEDEDDDDDDDLQLPGPPGLLAQAEPSRSSLSSGEGASEDDTSRLPDSPSRLGERTSSRALLLPDSGAEPSTSRARSRGRSETTTSSRRSSHGRPYYVPRDDCDAASYQEGSDRAGPASPRRYEEQAGGRLAPAMNGELGEQRLRNRRRRRRRRPYDVNRNHGQDQTMYHHRGRREMTHGNQNNEGQDQRMQGYHHRGREEPQGFRGKKSGAPHGNAPPDFSLRHGCSSSHYRLYSRLHGRDNAKNGVQEPPSSTGGYYQHREAHGRDQQGCHGRRQTPAREKPPKTGGGYREHGSRETPPPCFRPPPPPPQAHGSREECSCGGWPNPAARERGLVADEGRYQQTQTEAPRRGRARAPVRPYHPYYPYAPDDENQVGRHEHYQHRRDVEARTRDWRADRSRRPYGAVQK